METRRRTVVKATLWNLVGFLMMAVVGLTWTGSVAVGGAIALINTAVGFACYLVYERIWTRVSWGRT